MWDLSVALGGGAGAGAVGGCVLAVVAQRGVRWVQRGDIFAEDFMKVQGAVDLKTWVHPAVFLSRPGLQVLGESTQVAPISRQVIVSGWVTVRSLHHTQPPALLHG